MNQVLEIIIVIAGIIAVGVLVGTIIRYTSCWNRLEKLYLNDPKSVVTNLGITHLNIATPYDPTGYFNNFRFMTMIGTNEQGVSLSMILPFRLFFRPIFIPWNEIFFADQSYIGLSGEELFLTKLPEIQLIFPHKFTAKLKNFSKKTIY